MTSVTAISAYADGRSEYSWVGPLTPLIAFRIRGWSLDRMPKIPLRK